MSKIIELIQNEILVAYGSFKTPNYSFVEKRYDKKPYKKVKQDLSAVVDRIDDITDLNEDISCVWLLYLDGIKWLLQLSLIGNYSFLMRMTSDEECDYLAGSLNKKTDANDQRILSILTENKIQVLDKAILESVIDWVTDSEHPEGVSLFRIIFSDIETLPWRK